jgi:hypothetical protein
MHDQSRQFFELAGTLASDCIHLFSPAAAPDIRVVYDPGKNNCVGSQTERGEILIGVGKRRPDDTPVPDGAGIMLQHKGTDYSSVSEYVQHAMDREVEVWRQSLGNPATPHHLRATLYIEDASPDTCLGFVLFLARVFGVEREGLPATWCAYATRWESGDTQTIGAPFASWGCLHSALGHSFIAPQQNESQLDASGVEASFPVCLRYLLFLLVQQVDPDQIPEQLPSEEHARARAHLQQEYQAYRQSLTSAELLQLRVPMRNVQRTLLIDAYLATEVTVSGVKKVFVRSDSEHSWLQQGFSLMALYRPIARGTGDDIVVSVTPSTGIDLKALWQELERLEDERWEGQRPCDDPRPGIAEYPGGCGPNQPWWDEGGRYTLIAAPRKIGDQYGSKLGWDDVRETIWSLYNPAKELKFIPDGAASGGSKPLHQCPATETGAGETKRLVIAKWDENNDDPLALSPTMKRYMAACAITAHPDRVRLSDLPDERSFDFLELPGGFAVIHNKGVLLIDDWSSEPLDKSACQQEFEQMARRLETVRRLNQDLAILVQKVGALVKEGRKLSYMKIISQLSLSQLELRSALFATRALSEDEKVLTFRDRLEKRWGIDAQLANVNDVAEHMSTMVRDHAEVRSNYLISGLTIYGFPAIFFATFFQDIVAKFMSNGNWSFHGIRWFQLIIYVLLVAVFILILRHKASKLNRVGKTRADNIVERE